MSAADAADPPESNHVITPQLGELLDGPEGRGLCPGVNCCARCGGGEKGLEACPVCDRVAYCGAACLHADRKVHKLVCPLLQNMEELGDVDYSGGTSAAGEAHAEQHAALFQAALGRLEQHGLPEDWDALFVADADLAGQRLLSARLSYPLSLGWCLAQLPGLRTLRRTLAPKADACNLPGAGAASAAKATATSWVDVLILGASAAECGVEPVGLWALTAPRRSPGSPEGAGLRLTFVGPEVPSELSGAEVTPPPVPASSAGSLAPRLMLRYFRGSFDAFCAAGSATRVGGSHSQSQRGEQRLAAWLALDAQVLQVNAVVSFNPGFTCPDYNWSVGELAHSCEDTPFVLVTNTVTESNLDRACLAADHGVGLAKVTQVRNPFAWLAWRQSGTLANDVYRKNSAVLAGRVRQASGGGAVGGGGHESYADLARQVSKSGGKKGKRKSKKARR